jgi:hypothetical protein
VAAVGYVSFQAVALVEGDAQAEIQDMHSVVTRGRYIVVQNQKATSRDIANGKELVT